MIILPYIVHISGSISSPYVTFGIIVLCMLVFLLQATNEQEIDRLAYDYCKGISAERSVDRELDILRQGNCQ